MVDPSAIEPSFEHGLHPQMAVEFDIDRARVLGAYSEIIYPGTAAEKSADLLASQAVRAQRASRFYRWRRAARWFARDTSNPEDFQVLKARAAQARAHVAETEGARITAKFCDLGFETVYFLSAVSSQCVLASNATTTLICFRGTEPNRLADIYADAMALPVKRAPIRGVLHKGFYDALSEVWDQQVATVCRKAGALTETPRMTLPDCLDALQNSSDNSNNALWIAGHSLGGALATLAAARLVDEGILAAKDIGGVYTFGQPRVGDSQFVDQYAVAERHFRLVHKNDVVTRLPPQNLRLIGVIKEMFLGVGGTWLSESQVGLLTLYRHVGRCAYVSDNDRVFIDVGAWSLFQRSLITRITSVATGKSIFSRFTPGIGDHSMSAYNASLSASRHVEKDSIAAVNADRTSGLHALLLALIAGVAVGGLAGVVINTQAGVVVSSLLSLSALALVLDDAYLPRRFLFGLGTFGLVVLTVLLFMLNWF